MNKEYEYFLYPHVNRIGMEIIIFVFVDSRTRYTLI